jgi:hypothetical protein
MRLRLNTAVFCGYTFARPPKIGLPILQRGSAEGLTPIRLTPAQRALDDRNTARDCQKAHC